MNRRISFHSRWVAQRHFNEVLGPGVIPYAAAIGEDFVFMDDNARPHCAQITNQFLEDNGVERMEWQAISPDCNPIKHLWDDIKRHISLE